MQHGNLHIDIDTICYDNNTNNNNLALHSA